jgi:hypothetical protein
MDAPSPDLFSTASRNERRLTSVPPHPRSVATPTKSSKSFSHRAAVELVTLVEVFVADATGGESLGLWIRQRRKGGSGVAKRSRGHDGGDSSVGIRERERRRSAVREKSHVARMSAADVRSIPMSDGRRDQK